MITKKDFKKFLTNWSKNNKRSFRSFLAYVAENHIPYERGDLPESLEKGMIEFISKGNPTQFEGEIQDAIENDDDNAPTPKVKQNYIGIEIECFSSTEFVDMNILALKNGLGDIVQIGRDGSVEPDHGEDYELRFLIKESELSKVLKRVAKFLKEAECDVNESCGLHIHLDMRQRKMEECYKKLVKFQDLLFAMVDKDRQDNENGYCAYVTEYNKTNRMVAINRQAYGEHGTLEIRLHQGCVDVKKIENWINLLLKIVNTRAKTKKIELSDKKAVLKWLGNNKKLKTYVNKTYDKDWFTEDEYQDDDGMELGLWR